MVAPRFKVIPAIGAAGLTAVSPRLYEIELIVTVPSMAVMLPAINTRAAVDEICAPAANARGALMVKCPRPVGPGGGVADGFGFAGAWTSTVNPPRSALLTSAAETVFVFVRLSLIAEVTVRPAVKELELSPNVMLLE